MVNGSDDPNVIHSVTGNTRRFGTYTEVAGHRYVGGIKDSHTLKQFDGPQNSLFSCIFNIGTLLHGYALNIKNSRLHLHPLYESVRREGCQTVNGKTQKGSNKNFLICPGADLTLDKDVKTVSFVSSDWKLTIDKFEIQEVKKFGDEDENEPTETTSQKNTDTDESTSQKNTDKARMSKFGGGSEALLPPNGETADLKNLINDIIPQTGAMGKVMNFLHKWFGWWF